MIHLVICQANGTVAMTHLAVPPLPPIQHDHLKVAAHGRCQIIGQGVAGSRCMWARTSAMH